MSAARLVLITKIVKKLGITQLWNADKVLISPGAFHNAERFVQKNKKVSESKSCGLNKIPSVWRIMEHKN